MGKGMAGKGGEFGHRCRKTSRMLQASSAGYSAVLELMSLPNLSLLLRREGCLKAWAQFCCTPLMWGLLDANAQDLDQVIP